MIDEESELEWFEKYAQSELTQEEVNSLEQYLSSEPERRKRFRQFMRFDAYLQIQSQSSQELENENISSEKKRAEITPLTRITPIFFSVAAMLLVAFTAIFIWNSNQTSVPEQEESRLEGYAVIRRLLNEEWKNGQALKIGDLVTNSTLELEKGLVQIDFFCGASVVLQGPAKLEVNSAWSATCHEGDLRAIVPPAARGFKINTAQGQIEDLGTEFSVSVKGDQSKVHVIDGKVLVHKENQSTREMNTGDRLKVTQAGFSEHSEPGLEIAGLEDIRSGSHDKEAQSFSRWTTHRDQLMSDQRLRAYFPMDKSNWQDNRILNRSPIPSDASNDAIMLGFANQQKGRFGHDKRSLDVRRPDARARVYIEGEFKAYTFFTWVRIDSLAHQYNALFMGDNYNNGEPHWQIREDGKLMISIMVNEKLRGKAPYHQIYFSPVFWDDSLSGKWIQIASTYDPAKREVANYFNGELLNREKIVDRFYIEDLKVGGAEIGSWGLPFKADDTHFSLRNLNGLIDELMIFDSALSESEIKKLYERSRP